MAEVTVQSSLYPFNKLKFPKEKNPPPYAIFSSIMKLNIFPLGGGFSHDYSFSI